MQWNFDERHFGNGRLVVAADILLFFVAVVLIIGAAVLPTNHFASGAVLGAATFWHSLLLTGPIGFIIVVGYLGWRRRIRRMMPRLADPEELTIAYRFVNGMVVLSIGGWVLYSALNAKLDHGQKTIIFSPVLGKTVEDDGRFESFHLTVANWHKFGGTIDIAVSDTFYKTVRQKGGCLRLVVKPGAFGHEWIVRRDHFTSQTLDGQQFEDQDSEGNLVNNAAPDFGVYDHQKQCLAAWAALSTQNKTAGIRK